MKLFYREFGSGIPLIILHGLYGSSDNWVSIARVLSESFRVILPDLRNHGLSPHHPLHSYDAMSADLDELVSELGLSKYFLLGHSMGGKTAIYHARKYAGRIAGLMIIDISPFKADNKNSPQAEFHRMVLDTLATLPLDKAQSRKELDKLLSARISSLRIRQFILKNISRNMNKTFRWKLNPRFLRNNLDNILDGFDRGSALDAQIAGFPVVFVRAGKSDYIRETDYEDIMKLFPSSEIVEIEDSSHWIHTEKPETIVKLIREMAE